MVLLLPRSEPFHNLWFNSGANRYLNRLGSWGTFLLLRKQKKGVKVIIIETISEEEETLHFNKEETNIIGIGGGDVILDVILIKQK